MDRIYGPMQIRSSSSTDPIASLGGGKLDGGVDVAVKRQAYHMQIKCAIWSPKDWIGFLASWILDCYVSLIQSVSDSSTGFI